MSALVFVCALAGEAEEGIRSLGCAVAGFCGHRASFLRTPVLGIVHVLSMVGPASLLPLAAAFHSGPTGKCWYELLDLNTGFII